MPVEKCADAEPIRGYRLLERLGAGGFGEVWKCEAPGGIFKAVKFVYGSLNSLDNNSAHAEEELRAFQLIKSIRHPFLLSMDRVEIVGGELVIVTELADENLHELWEHYHLQGRHGIPRDELLRYLTEVAEVLDLLNQKFDLQHLDVKPRNLFLVSNHVKVADFGLVNSLAEGVTEKLKAALNAVTPLYAAPELFLGKLSRHCDQYSLGIVFQELLTGTLPFTGKNLRQLLIQHTQTDPDLQPLPAHDRVIVARALAKNPEHRFASCMDFVRALKAEMPKVPKLDSDDEMALATTPAPGDTILAPRFGDTTRLPRPTARPVLPDNVLADWRFLECVSNSPLMEVWKAQTPDGDKKRVKILYGLGCPDIAKLKEALNRLKTIEHPALQVAQVAHVEPGRLVLINDPIRETMRDRAHQCQARKQPGIPRTELIDYIRGAAEVLDYLYLQHSVQHLNLNPRNLILANGWLQIAEFGYAQLLWAPAGQDIVQRNLRYAAPELVAQTPSRHCDQYSLALIYAELLTGVHPFRGLGPQAYLAKNMKPDLERLPDLDREAIARALRFDPSQRFSNCTEMLLALEGTSAELNGELQEKPDHFAHLIENARNVRKRSIYTGIDPEKLNEIIAGVINDNGGQADAELAAAPITEAGGDALQFHFVAGLPLGAAQEQLRVFAQQMFAHIIRQNESGCTIHFDLPITFWQQWCGQQPKLELQIEMARVNPLSSTPIEIKARLRAVDCPKQRATELFDKMSPEIFAGLQQHLLVNSEKRTKDRLLWAQNLTIVPLDANGQPEEAIECRGKDLSQTGVGFYLPHELSSAEVLIVLPNPCDGSPLRIPATLVRAKRCADGWYEVGALFRLPTARRSMAEICI
ncbi:MAG TPA: protein kinase, partial [Gemmataceae bacterium]|nr:protein kinase [Gemmataceae bacterium]